MKFILNLGIILFCLICFTLYVKAEDLKLANSSLKIDVNKSITTLYYHLDYSTYTDKQIINEIEFTLPFKLLQDLKITSSGVDMPFTITDDAAAKIVKVMVNKFQNNFQFSPLLDISFSTNETYLEYPQGNYLYVPYFSSDFQIQQLNYEINYPDSLNKPDQVYIDSYFLSNSKISGITKGGIFVIWSDKNNIQGEFTLKFPADSNNNPNQSILINLPENNTKDIFYLDNPQFQYGIIDKQSNNYGVLKNNTVKDPLVFKFVSISKEYSNNSQEFTNHLFKNINTQSSIQAIHDSNQFESISSKMEFLNNYVVNTLDPILIEETDTSQLDTLNTRIDNKSKLTSFEYCYFLASLAQNINIPVRLVYGYEYLLGDKNIYTPHIWCEYKDNSVQDNNKILMIDPWMEDLYKLNFSSKLPVDRFIYGYINIDNLDNNALGLTSNSSDNLNIKFTSSKDELINKSNSFYINFPEYLKSGEQNNLEFHFNNDNYFRKIEYIEINNQNLSIEDSKYSFALAPNSENIINLKFNPGISLIVLPNFTLISNTKLNSGEYTYTQNINILPSSNLAIIVLLFLITIFLLIILFLHYNKVKRFFIIIKSKYTDMRRKLNNF